MGFFRKKLIFIYTMKQLCGKQLISNRIKKFHNEFENKKITRKFNGNLEVWKYESLDEAKRISGILKERIIEGLNESK